MLQYATQGRQERLLLGLCGLQRPLGRAGVDAQQAQHSDGRLLHPGAAVAQA